jgi:hypothetical protein
MIAKLDHLGRRYVEVPKFPAGPLKQAFAGSALPCTDCGTPLVHGSARYYQRSNSSGPMITFDAICGACGDRTIARAGFFSADQPRRRAATLEMERQKVKLFIVSQRATALIHHAVASRAYLQIVGAESVAANARAQRTLQSLHRDPLLSAAAPLNRHD